MSDDEGERPQLKRKASISGSSGPVAKKPKLEGKAKKYEKKINYKKEKYRRGASVKLDVRSLSFVHHATLTLSSLSSSWPSPLFSCRFPLPNSFL